MSLPETSPTTLATLHLQQLLARREFLLAARRSWTKSWFTRAPRHRLLEVGVEGGDPPPDLAETRHVARAEDLGDSTAGGAFGD